MNIEKQDIPLQLKWNIIAERNRNDSSIATLSKVGELLSYEDNGLRYHCYLSSNRKAISIIFDDSTYFRLPDYVIHKEQLPGDASRNILATYIMTLPNNDIIQFDIRYYANLKYSLAILMKDETYDYSTVETKTFYTPSISTNMNKANVLFSEDVIPVKIFFCISTSLFLSMWNALPTKSIANDLKNARLDVTFPRKNNYLDYYRFNVIDSIVSTPEIKRNLEDIEKPTELKLLFDSEEARRKYEVNKSLVEHAINKISDNRRKPNSRLNIGFDTEYATDSFNPRGALLRSSAVKNLSAAGKQALQTNPLSPKPLTTNTLLTSTLDAKTSDTTQSAANNVENKVKFMPTSILKNPINTQSKNKSVYEDTSTSSDDDVVYSAPPRKK